MWPVSLNARQQFFFEPSPALAEPLDLRLESIEELDDLAVLVPKRVEAYVSHQSQAYRLFVLREPRHNVRMRSTTPLASMSKV